MLYPEYIPSFLPSLVKMNPSKDVEALSKVEVDLTNLDEGRSTTVMWRGKPLFIKHRTKKKQSQPSRIKTCGSTFKNPRDKKAWELIKSANCSHFTIGGASISQKHNNFFINNGNATSLDIENLINKVKEEVFLKTGTKLELEIKIIGGK